MADIKTIMTPRARLSYPALFKARAMEAGGEAKFSCSLIFDKAAQNTPAFAAMKAQAAAAVAEKWGNKVPSGLRNPFRDGNERDDPAYADTIFVNASSKQQPQVVAGSIDPITGKLRIIDDPNEVYAGCYVLAAVRAYPYEIKGNRGVSFGLQALQKIAEGESLGGGVRATEVFKPVDESSVSDVNSIFG
jgi:hypothetical protein